MLKKITSILLIFLIVFSFPLEILAVDDSLNIKVQYLIDNKIVEGRTTDESGIVDYALDKTITRAETSKLLVYVLKLEKLAERIKGAAQVFSDVEHNHWANGFINVITTQREDIAYGRRIIVGYPDGKFIPEKDISYNELAAMLVRIVKEDLTQEMEDKAIWGTSYLNWAGELGLLEDIEIQDSSKAVTRKDAFIMVYNAIDILDRNMENKADFGEVMGIVSKVSSGEIQLNQDEKLRFKITRKSRATNGTDFIDIYENMDLPGSLVRVIADENKNVEYIIEMGNPKDLAIPGRWFGISDKIVSAKEDTSFKDNYTENYIIKVGDVEAIIDEDTRIFAADLDKNALGEMRALAEVFEMYKRNRKPIKNVYMGYDDYDHIKEAKVIVFGDVEKFLGLEELRRVMSPVDSNLQFTAQSMIGGLNKVFSLEDLSYFPYDYDLDYLDVIQMRFDSYERARLKSKPRVLIDYSEDNVYEVKKLGEKHIVLRDSLGKEIFFELGTTAYFTKDELKEGSHVQIFFMPPDFIVDIIGRDVLEDMDLDMENLDILPILKTIDIKDLIYGFGSIRSIGDFNFQAMAISVVDKDLKGTLPFGFRTRTESGYVTAMTGDKLIIANKKDGIEYDHRIFEIEIPYNEKEESADSKIVKLAYKWGFEIVYDVKEKYAGTKYIFNVEPYIDYEKIYGQSKEDVIEIIKDLEILENMGFSDEEIEEIFDSDLFKEIEPQAFLQLIDSQYLDRDLIKNIIEYLEDENLL